MDEDDLTLPSLPRQATNDSDDFQLPKPLPASLTQWSRKRATRSYELFHDDDANSSSIHTSSDPALFSSDETPDAENYSGGKRRRKKTYAGTWWGERLAGTCSSSGSRRMSRDTGLQKTTRKMTRNFDSGIFMNSDEGSVDLSSDSSFGADLIEEQKRSTVPTYPTLPRTPEPAKSTRSLSFGSPVSQILRSAKKPLPMDAREQHVLSVVRRCLEDCKEDVDLSSVGLEELPVEVRELATMIRDDPAASLLFESLVARPRLYLSNNLFRHFPAPILELSNLRLLSLRQNKLTRLPPGIRNLVKLETLNVSGNRLEFLPMEVLELMSKHRLVEVQSEPNLWTAFKEDQRRTDPEKTRISNRPRLWSGRSPHDELEGLHTLLRLVASSQERVACDVIATSKIRTPSLSEMVLRQLSKLNHSKRDLVPLMPEGTGPRVLEQLEELHAAQMDGDRQCARCQRRLVTPAGRWIEWWDIGTKGMSSSADKPSVGASLGKAGHILPFEVVVCEGCV